MNGTEWTEPGQGATAKALLWALDDVRTPARWDTNAMRHVKSIRANKKTNLRLTGELLTADDVKRIAEAK